MDFRASLQPLVLAIWALVRIPCGVPKNSGLLTEGCELVLFCELDLLLSALRRKSTSERDLGAASLESILRLSRPGAV